MEITGKINIIPIQSILVQDTLKEKYTSQFVFNTTAYMGNGEYSYDEIVIDSPEEAVELLTLLADALKFDSKATYSQQPTLKHWQKYLAAFPCINSPSDYAPLVYAEAFYYDKFSRKRDISIIYKDPSHA